MASTEQALDIPDETEDLVLPNGLKIRDIDAIPTDEASFDFPPDLSQEMINALLHVHRDFLDSLREGVRLTQCFRRTVIQLQRAGFKPVQGRFVVLEPNEIRPYGFTQSHRWAEHNGVIYELTGAQFNDRLPKTDLFPLGLKIIRPGDKMYHAFVPHEPRQEQKKHASRNWFRFGRNKMR